jgi:hypothetical protein
LHDLADLKGNFSVGIEKAWCTDFEKSSLEESCNLNDVKKIQSLPKHQNVALLTLFLPFGPI